MSPETAARARRWLFTLLALTIAVAPSSAFADAASDDYNSALGFYRRMRWDYASKQFEVFLKNHPKHEKAPLAKFYLGQAYVNQDQFKKAREALREFVKELPADQNVAQARYRIGECSYLLDDLKGALPELQEFVQKHPQDPLAERALPYLGDVQLRLGQADAALATFDKALQDYPKGALAEDAKFGRAKSLEALKRDAEAIRQFQELASNPEGARAADAQFQIAARHFEEKRFADAAAAYQDLLRRFPKSALVPSARLNSGYALYQSGQFAEAALQFAAAQKDPQNSVTAAYWRGLCLKSLGDFPQAVTLLTQAAKEAGDLPLAEAIHFQRAICTRLAGDAAGAQKLFVAVVEKWPQGEFADDCLHAAAELAVDAGDVSTATALLARFAKEHPGSGLRLHYDLLTGRVDLAQAAAAAKAGKPAAEIHESYRLAAERFEKVLKESTVPRTQLLARYYLGLTRQLQNQHDETLKTLAPLVEVVLVDAAKSAEFSDALVVQAESQLVLKQFDAAQATADKYVSLFPKGRQTPRALFVVAVAGANRNDSAASTAALERLTKEFRTHPLTPTTLLQLAELSEKLQDWPMAAARYSALAAISEGTDNQAFAIRGWAWALFKQKQYGPAAEQFGRVVKQFPKHKLNSECSYYFGEALREDGKLEPALTAYSDVFQRFSPENAAAPESEKDAPLIYAYRGGLQKARTLQQLMQIEKADEAYAALLAKFPRPATLDKLLDEWALMNYGAKNYARADEIFARLIKEAPNSELADNARLSLAESDLLSDKLKEARQAFEQLLASDKSDQEVKERSLYQLIVLAVDQQRWDDVRSLSERLTRDFPGSPNLTYAHYSEAEAIVTSPKASEAELAAARQKLETVMKSAGKDLPKDAFHGRAWVLSAEIAFRQKDYPEVLRLAADLNDTLPESVFLYQIEEVVGRSHKQQANFAEARAAFQRVLADRNAFRTATAAKSQYLLADTYFLEEKWEDAFLAFQKVYASYDHPDWQAPALLYSGICDEKLQQWKEAAKTYAQLIEEFPKSEFVAEARQRLDAAKKKAGS